MEKLMKLVSTMTLYGGPSAELCLKKSAEDVASLGVAGARGEGRQRGDAREKGRERRD